MWTDPLASGALKLYVAKQAFNEFFGLSPEIVQSKLKPMENEYRELMPAEVEEFTEGLKELMTRG